jgi:hypothetical protein
VTQLPHISYDKKIKKSIPPEDLYVSNLFYTGLVEVVIEVNSNEVL